MKVFENSHQLNKYGLYLMSGSNVEEFYPMENHKMSNISETVSRRAKRSILVPLSETTPIWKIDNAAIFKVWNSLEQRFKF